MGSSFFRKKNLQILALALLSLSQGSCAKKILPSGNDPSLFYNIVYLATYTRETENDYWYPVQGKFQAKFSQSNSKDSTSQTNNFIFHYSSYFEPQFCPYNLNCVCSGGVDGTFYLLDPNEGSTSGGTTPYNPLDTYTPEGGVSQSNSGTTTQPNISTIYSYFFNLVIGNKSLSSGCKKENDRTIRILRFSNGDLLMNNDYRQIYFVPEVLK